MECGKLSFNINHNAPKQIMAKQRHLTRAPITEALIDVRVTAKGDLTFEELHRSVSAVEFGYFIKGPIAQGHFGFTIPVDGQPAESTVASSQIGLRLHSHDERYVAQFRLSGLTLSRLAPYEDWEKMVDEAKRVWAVYTKCLAPVRVKRIAARYINNLNLPLKSGESYQTYIHKLVDVPEDAPQAVTSFFQRFQLVDTDSLARVNLTLALDEIQIGQYSPVILDIDAFNDVDFAPMDEKMWETLGEMRDLKNKIFFSVITEHAAELYI